MDGLGTGTVETTATLTSGETTEKETPESSQGTESVASEKGNEQASGSQDSAEGGKVDGQQERRRGPSKLDTIKELRAERRERDQQIQELRSQLEQLNKRFSTPQVEKKPGKTFWEAPEEILDEKLSSKMQTLRDEILEQLQQREVDSQQSTQWKQETSDAAKFISSQKGVTEEDHEDIAEIIRSSPEMRNLSPMQRAKYGLFLWQQERGIVDKSDLKRKASTVSGSATPGTGPKVWTNAEIDAKIASFPKDKAKWTKEDNANFDAFHDEVLKAVEQGRVK